MIMIKVLLGAALMIVTWGLLHHEQGKWMMVWHAECIERAEKSPEMTLVAPLKKDGTPDMARAVAYKTRIVYRRSCGRIEKFKEE